VVVAEIQRIVEKNRRNGDIYEKAAFDIYRDCDAVLAAFKTCERIVTTPIPYQYTHMVNLVLFFFVFSAPLIFTVTFKWITPFPSAILALGFYGRGHLSIPPKLTSNVNSSMHIVYPLHAARTLPPSSSSSSTQRVDIAFVY
jgi:predicted membrane chloride channel (bestrophin family)